MPDNQRTGPLREAILAASKKREQFKQWLTRVNVAAGQERFNYDEISDRMLMRVKSHVLNDVVNKTNEAAKSVEFQWLTNHIVETSYDSGVGGGSMDETVRCSALDQTITKATGFARERTGRRKWCTHNEKFICGLTRESLAQNLRLSAKMMDDDTDTDASIKQLLARRENSGRANGRGCRDADDARPASVSHVTDRVDAHVTAARTTLRACGGHRNAAQRRNGPCRTTESGGAHRPLAANCKAFCKSQCRRRPTSRRRTRHKTASARSSSNTCSTSASTPR